MFRRSKIVVGALLAATLAATLLVTVATPATAADGRSNPPPGPGWVWGAPLASLPTNCNADVDQGGWSQQIFYSSGRFSSSSYQLVPAVFYIGEPCYQAAQSNGQRIRLGGNAFSMPTATSPLTDTSQLTGSLSTGLVTSGDWYLRCATSEWTQSATVRTSNSSQTYSLAGPSASNSGSLQAAANVAGFSAWGTAVTDAQCPYVVSATGKVCYFITDGAAPWGSDTPHCVVITWWAEDWFRGKSYGRTGSYEQDLCTRDSTASSDCIYTLPSENIEGTSFDEVCAQAPVFTAPGWADFDQWVPSLVAWWQAAIGHYGRCLFYPINGWDQDELIPNRWETSSFAEATALMEDATDAFTFSESCGLIVPFGDVPAFPGASGGVSTCDWSGWGSTVRAGIGVVLTLGFAWWAIQFVITTLLALFRAVPMYDPLTMANMIHHHVPGNGE